MTEKKTKSKFKRKLVFFLMLILIMVFGFIAIKSDVFYIKEIVVVDNFKLTKSYVKEKTNINDRDNIFLIDLDQIKTMLENETYIKNANIRRRFPDKLVINIEERKGRISYNYKYKKYLLDFEGFLLEEIKKSDDLFIIESKIETDTKIGKKITFKNSIIKFDKILNISRYIYENNKNLNCNILLKDDNIYCVIEKNTYIKFDLTENLNYQYEFGIDIMETRINEGQSIKGVIDFTKGDNPIYVDFKDLEEEI